MVLEQFHLRTAFLGGHQRERVLLLPSRHPLLTNDLLPSSTNGRLRSGSLHIV
jgi:hypothetical protein